MGFTNVYATVIADAVSKNLAGVLRNTHAFLASVPKVIVPKGQSSVSIPIPGTMTTTTRAAGAVLPAGTKPTDTAITITPSTEQICVLPLDRVDVQRSAVDLAALYGPLMSSGIITAINTALWALIPSGISTNSVGDTDAAADPSLLAQAWSKLFTAKCPMSGLVACIGGAEAQAWLPQGAFNTYGPAGQAMLTEATFPMMYGFTVKPDQQRYFAASATNLAFHPSAFALGFRSETVPRQGTAFGQSTDAQTGITVFTEISSMSESTNGCGNNLSAWVLCDPKVVYESWACLVKGAAAA